MAREIHHKVLETHRILWLQMNGGCWAHLKMRWLTHFPLLSLSKWLDCNSGLHRQYINSPAPMTLWYPQQALISKGLFSLKKRLCHCTTASEMSLQIMFTLGHEDRKKHFYWTLPKLACYFPTAVSYLSGAGRFMHSVCIHLNYFYLMIKENANS